MEKRGKSISGGMKIIGNFYSAAARQAKGAEFDDPSNTTGDASSVSPTGAGTALGEGIAHQEIVDRSFPVLGFLNDTKYRVEQSKTDEFARKTFRKLPEQDKWRIGKNVTAYNVKEIPAVLKCC